MKLKYTVIGSAHVGGAYEVTGEIHADSPLDPEAHNAACVDSFRKLTSGKAVFGKPGQGGCRGPYKVSKLVLEDAEAAARADLPMRTPHGLDVADDHQP